MPSVTILRNVAADAWFILEKRHKDKRRAEPFRRLADRFDDGMPADLGPALERAVKGLEVSNPAAADEIRECLVRWQDEMARP